MDYSRDTLLGSIFWKLLERFSSQVISFCITVILARILLPQEYGIIAIILVFINFANVLIDGGLNLALVQKKDADELDFSTIFHFCMASSLVMYAILYVSAPYISGFYGNEILTDVLRVLGLNVFMNSFCSIQRAYISKNMLFRRLFAGTLIAVVVSGSVGIYLAYSGCGVWALVWQQLTNQFTMVVVLSIIVPWHPKFVFSSQRFKTLFGFGWKILLTNLLIEVYEDSRSLVIGKIYKPSSLAFFDRGKQLPFFIMTNINASIQAILLPAFSNIQDDPERLKNVMRRSIKMTSFFIVPALFGMLAAAEPFVIAFFSEKWTDAIPFVRIFCLAYLLMPIQSSNMSAIQAVGHSEITLKLEIAKKIIEAVILVVSFFINVYAVAWGCVLYNFISLVINLYPNRKLIDYGVFEQLRDVAPIYFSGILMCLFIYLINFVNIGSWMVLFIQVIVGVALYLMFCRLLKVDSLDYSVMLLRQKFKF